MTMRKTADTLTPASGRDAETPDAEEGARYALLQRLAPALQHHMMGQFQSVGMIAAMMEKRLQSAEPDLANLRGDCASLGSVSQTAVLLIINMMSWIEPKTAATIKFNAGVTECVGLLATQLRFKDFVIVNEVPEMDLVLSSRALRGVLSATLIALSDLAQVPADLVIQARIAGKGVELSIDLRPSGRSSKNMHSTAYRALMWRDVEALATADAVAITHSATGAQLIFNASCQDSESTLAKNT